MRQFEVWWADLPAPAGERPVLLLSRDSAYTYLNKFMVAEITTTIRNIPQEVPLGEAEGLAEACVANLDNLRTVPKSRFSKLAGRVAQTRHSEIKRALGMALDLPELTLPALR